jgi:3-hydroxymyristoyl/3-hydroxydecanoyl-(acyl carrier protein) dehydratase
MRWFWVDRFEEFVRCRRAVAIKAVTLAEEHLHDHFPGAALVPNSLVLEGLAQEALGRSAYAEASYRRAAARADAPAEAARRLAALESKRETVVAAQPQAAPR